ncbi:hypothetical protein I7I50_05879 [Histoplasma capsulatum G186AR]|uniref:Uncharacterized protein n=1 Tax=Ajellomyces capsulatus TaxID=5037 RepID=A0A8H7Z9Y2_AJECA|nr:hypothetical protein I7I52_04138 [Histoplasma capsulatum]QSS76428.1 hypothetical protein I7I50_05879 [Histoplasma capsulatum G186AR]
MIEHENPDSREEIREQGNNRKKSNYLAPQKYGRKKKEWRQNGFVASHQNGISSMRHFHNRSLMTPCSCYPCKSNTFQYTKGK